MVEQEKGRELLARPSEPQASSTARPAAASRRVVLEGRVEARPHAPAEGRTPLILDVGKQSKKAIKALKRGRGKLMTEVEQVLEDVRRELGAESQGKELVPVILVYRQSRRRRARLL